MFRCDFGGVGLIMVSGLGFTPFHSFFCGREYKNRLKKMKKHPKGIFRHLDNLRHLNARVLLVCKPGLGDCIDSFNLCSSYFRSNGCTILGMIVNKIPSDGMMKKTRYVYKYFTNHHNIGRVYGLLSTSPHLETINAGQDSACAISFKKPEDLPPITPLNEEHLHLLDRFVREHFQPNVEVDALLSDLRC